jgi:hypothetical protein
MSIDACRMPHARSYVTTSMNLCFLVCACRRRDIQGPRLAEHCFADDRQHRSSTPSLAASQLSGNCFALHSRQLLEPLLSQEMLEHPAWVCWLKLVELFSLVIQHTLTQEQIERIDDLQLEHAELFDRVPEFAGLARPKHHFLTHIAMDAWNYGPPRGYWCFGFEGFNRVIKAGAQLSNWKDETMSILRYWSVLSAHELRPD